MLKTFIRNIILLSITFVVLTGSDAFYRVIESCIEKSVSIDMDMENELEDDFEDELKLKTFFQYDQKSFLLSLLDSSKNTFRFEECVIHNDLAEVFGPPPDLFN